MTDAEHKSQDSVNKQNTLLAEVNDRLKENTKLILAGIAISKKVASALRLQWFCQLGLELKDFMRRIFALNVATYQAVISIQRGLPSHLERTLIQEPFILDDAIGRIAPVHMQFITSWEAFDSVLELRFRNFPGHKKVQDKEYIFQEHATGREIDRSYAWDASFLPGQRIEMSMIFKSTRSVVSTCPRCQLATERPQNSDIQW